MRLLLCFFCVAFIGVSLNHGLSLPFIQSPLTRRWFKPKVINEETKLKIHTSSDPFWFDQILDHFNSSNLVIWKQRYWNNLKFAKVDGPQFIQLGGEGPLSGDSIFNENRPHVIWAKNLSAGLWLLEHRFYGKSRPFPTQTTKNLKYLSSRQSLADVASFIETQNKKLNLTNPKWVIFGGSYAGALALWFRELYPHLAVGAVGSSGPIEPKLDFYEFLKFCENSIHTFDPKCEENIQEAFHDLEKYVANSEGRKALELIFTQRSEYPLQKTNLSPADIQNFYIRAIGFFEQAVQYNGDPKNGKISTICKIMSLPSSNKVLNLGLVSSHMSQLQDWNVGRKDPSYPNYIDYLKNPYYYSEGQAAMRSWVWQTCNEFGFFATTNIPDGSIFGNKVSKSFYIGICTDVYGKEFNTKHIKKGIAKTLREYGGRNNYTGTNVVAPRGSVDPWSALTLQTSTDPSVIPYLIEGGSHCSDMAEPQESDSESLKKLRILIFENIKKWIGVLASDDFLADDSSNAI